MFPEYYTQSTYLNSFLLLAAHLAALVCSSPRRAPGVAQHLHSGESIGDGESFHGIGQPQKRMEGRQISRPRPDFGTALDRWTGGLLRGHAASICSICIRLKARCRQPVKAVRRSLSLQTAAACHRPDKREKSMGPGLVVMRPIGDPAAARNGGVGVSFAFVWRLSWHPRARS
jgi:hypothetical protein